RLKLSGDVGLLYKDDADRLIENIPSDLDTFTFNREFASDPAHAQRLLVYGAYPNIRPELREELVKQAKEIIPDFQPAVESQEPAAKEVQAVNTESHSIPNNGEPPASKGAGGADLLQTAAAATKATPSKNPAAKAASTATPLTPEEKEAQANKNALLDNLVKKNQGP